MKRLFLSTIITTFFLIGIFNSANALTINFSDKDFLDGASWGTMVIDHTSGNANSLTVTYTASGIAPVGSEATGFGFSFATDNPTSIANPDLDDITGDEDDLNWVIYSKKMNTFPQPANGNEFDPEIGTSDFFFGATEGEDNTLNPPGIEPGETDVFYLVFGKNISSIALESLVTAAGVRLQSLPDEINGGSLFLAGDSTAFPKAPPAVPEPGIMMLLGTGLLGVAGISRRKIKI